MLHQCTQSSWLLPLEATLTDQGPPPNLTEVTPPPFSLTDLPQHHLPHDDHDSTLTSHPSVAAEKGGALDPPSVSGEVHMTAGGLADWTEPTTGAGAVQETGQPSICEIPAGKDEFLRMISIWALEGLCM